MTRQELREYYETLNNAYFVLMFIWYEFRKDGDDIIDEKMDIVTDLIDDVLKRLIEKLEG